MDKNNFKSMYLFREYGRLKEESLYPIVDIIKKLNIIDELIEEVPILQQENQELKDNWNKLKENLKFDIELYDTTLLHRKMTSDKVLKEMEELEISNNNMSDFFRVTGDYKYMWVDEKIYNELKNHVLNGGYIFIECPYQKPIKLKVVED